MALLTWVGAGLSPVAGPRPAAARRRLARVPPGTLPTVQSVPDVALATAGAAGAAPDDARFVGCGGRRDRRLRGPHPAGHLPPRPRRTRGDGDPRWRRRSPCTPTSPATISTGSWPAATCRSRPASGRQGAGRPSKRFFPAGDDPTIEFLTRRDDLLVPCCGRRSSCSGPSRPSGWRPRSARTTGGRWPTRMAPGDGQRSVRAAMHAIAETLTAHGFAAHAEDHGDATAVVAEQCPFGDAATEHPVLCAVDRGMVKGLLSGLCGEHTRAVPRRWSSRPAPAATTPAPPWLEHTPPWPRTTVGDPVARHYLDHASTSPLRPEVVAALQAWMDEPAGDPGRVHEEGRRRAGGDRGGPGAGGRPALRAATPVGVHLRRDRGDQRRRVGRRSGPPRGGGAVRTGGALRGARRLGAVGRRRGPPGRPAGPHRPGGGDGGAGPPRWRPAGTRPLPMGEPRGRDGPTGRPRWSKRAARPASWSTSTPPRPAAISISTWPSSMPTSCRVSGHKFGGPTRRGGAGRPPRVCGSSRYLVGGQQERGRRAGMENGAGDRRLRGGGGGAGGRRTGAARRRGRPDARPSRSDPVGRASRWTASNWWAIPTLRGGSPTSSAWEWTAWRPSRCCWVSTEPGSPRTRARRARRSRSSPRRSWRRWGWTPASRCGSRSGWSTTDDDVDAFAAAFEPVVAGLRALRS